MLKQPIRSISSRRSPPKRGFTLIELMITLVLLGVLFGLAMPSFTTWIKNTQIRSVAEALQNGLRVAQNEAVRRNRVVIFSRTNTTPAANAVAVATGKNWGVQYVPHVADDAPVAPAPFVQGGALSEVSSNVQITSVGGIAAVCFNSNGRLITAAAAVTFPGSDCTASNVVFDITQPGADVRPLRVTVDFGGRVRMCDPARPTTAPDGC